MRSKSYKAFISLKMNSYKIGKHGEYLAFDYGTYNMYVNDELSGTVLVIGYSTENVIKGVNLGPYPVADLLDPVNGYICVFSFGSASAARINSNSQTIISTIRVGYRPHEKAPDTYTGFIYVVDEFLNAIHVIHTRNNSEVSSINLVNCFVDVAFNQHMGNIIAYNGCSNNVSVLNFRSLVLLKNIALGNQTISLLLNSDHGTVFVSNLESVSIVIYSGNGRYI